MRQKQQQKRPCSVFSYWNTNPKLFLHHSQTYTSQIDGDGKLQSDLIFHLRLVSGFLTRHDNSLSFNNLNWWWCWRKFIFYDRELHSSEFDFSLFPLFTAQFDTLQWPWPEFSHPSTLQLERQFVLLAKIWNFQNSTEIFSNFSRLHRPSNDSYKLAISIKCRINVNFHSIEWILWVVICATINILTARTSARRDSTIFQILLSNSIKLRNILKTHLVFCCWVRWDFGSEIVKPLKLERREEKRWWQWLREKWAKRS